MTFWLFQVPRLGLVSLFQIWDFCGYSSNTLKYPKMRVCLFFPVILTQERKERRKGRVQREKKKEGG